MKKMKKSMVSFLAAVSVLASAPTMWANAAYRETTAPPDHSGLMKLDFLCSETTDFYISEEAKSPYEHSILVETKYSGRVYFGTSETQGNAAPKVKVPDEISALFSGFTTENGDSVTVAVYPFNSGYDYYVTPYNIAQNAPSKLTPSDARRIKDILIGSGAADCMCYAESVYSPAKGYTYLTHLTVPSSLYDEEYDRMTPAERAEFRKKAAMEAAETVRGYLADKDYDVTLNTENGITLTPNRELTLEEHIALIKELSENCKVQPEFIVEASTSERFGGVDLYSAVDGDANCDEAVNMGDAVLIMQSLANPDKYKLTEQGRFNSDINGDGITNTDALSIQKMLLGL